ncbi:MAG: hypothetical protein ACLPY3_04520 [Solirubrobacteraceae bacterium]
MFLTLAVAFIRIVTGRGPHEKRMIPPARTAATTAAEVQLAGVPCPTTRFGCAVSTGAPAAGTGTARGEAAPDTDQANTDAAKPGATELAGGAVAARHTATIKLAIPPEARCRTPPG